MSFEVRALRMEEREECLNLWCTVWPGEGSDAYFRKYFYGDVEWLPYYTQVGVLDGRLVSAAHVCKRIVQCGDFRLTMGGLANVATLPEYRSCGYNTRCLQQLIAVMEADAMDFSLLGTGINGYYARLGYDTLPLPSLSGTFRSDFTALPGSFDVRPAEARDVPEIQEIYSEYNRSRPLTVRRSEAYWRDWIGVSSSKAPDDTIVAADPNGKVCGYARSGVFLSAEPYSEEAKSRRVTELGVSDRVDHSACIRSLLVALVSESPSKREKMLLLSISLDSEVVAAASDFLENIRYHYDHSMMVRLLHRDNLLKSLVMELNDRWIVGGKPDGIAHFATPYGPIRLDATGSLLRASSVDGECPALSQATLFGLLFGLIRPEQVTDDADAEELLRVLFPAQGAVYYGSDGF